MTARRPTGEKPELEKLLALDSEKRRAMFLSRHRSLLRPDLVTQLTDQVREQVRVDVQQAVRGVQVEPQQHTGVKEVARQFFRCVTLDGELLRPIL